MSHKLIERSPDLKRFRDEGYNVAIVADHLVVSDIPYLTSDKKVRIGALVTDLVVSGDVVSGMGSHVIQFTGDFPHHLDGSPLEVLRHGNQQTQIAPGLVTKHRFSMKPVGVRKYADYYQKVTTYIGMISGPALEVDPSKDPRTDPVYEAKEDESVFRYIDTNSSRAGLGTLAEKLSIRSVGIIGLGGTGAYILDHVAKTPVGEIHLFDGDAYSNHNAFRSPGAASLEELKERPSKVAYYHALYSKMRWGIHAHPELIDEKNVEQLRSMVFVFLCIDNGQAKKLIVRKLEEFGIPFIDVGMGVDLAGDGSLFGTLRVTTSTPEMREQVHTGARIPFEDGEEENLYATNIQLSVLNSLNANFAVIKWMKLMGFLHDPEREHFTAYSLDGNFLVNEDHGPCPINALRTAS